MKNVKEHIIWKFTIRKSSSISRIVGNTLQRKVFILMVCPVKDNVANCSTTDNCGGFTHLLPSVDSPEETSVKKLVF
jgi:hypothetical protein